MYYRLDLGARPWWMPLDALAKLTRQQSGRTQLCPAKFMFAGLARCTDRPDVAVYKHEVTRSYLCVDACGHLYTVKGSNDTLQFRLTELEPTIERFTHMSRQR